MRSPPAAPARNIRDYKESKKIFLHGDSDSENDSDEDVSTWSNLKDDAIDAICVHLVDAERYDFETVLVMIPVLSKDIAGYTWKDLEASMTEIAAMVFTFFLGTRSFQRLSRRGSIEKFVRQHKVDDHEVAGYRIIVQQCKSESPAFVIEFQPNTTREKFEELMHFYSAMGIHKQHGAQQMLLGRI